MTLGKWLNFSGPHCVISLWGFVHTVPFASTTDVPSRSILLHLASNTPSFALGLTLALLPSLSQLALHPPPAPKAVLDAPSQRSHSPGVPVITIQCYITISCLLDSSLKAGPMT